ncbi:MAG TPA: glycosyltransferase family 4 protein [Solirubrobacteraceae bacterium]|nr:glycosyltransferase family 4 protein [Solirubrobacteraceae bacterium]
MTRLLYLSADPGVPVLGHKGASVHVRELAQALADAGVDVHIATPRVAPEGEVLRPELELHVIPPVPLKGHAVTAVQRAVRAQVEAVTALAAGLEVDAIYERFSLFSPAGVRAAGALELPHALEVNAPLREEARRYRTLPHPELARAFEAEVMTRTDRVLAVSEALAGTLARDGVAREKIEVLPNGVASHRFRPPRRDPSRFVVGFAGSLKPWHGVDTMVAAVARVPEVHLEVLGHGPGAELLDLLPPERVTRLGARPHSSVAAAMAGWDVGLAPYAPVDGFWFSPLKVLEYMAAGACPVVSDLGDAATTLGGGERGVLVPAADIDGLASAICALARDRGRAQLLGERARAWVRTHRSWSANAERVLGALGLRAAAPTREAA